VAGKAVTDFGQHAGLLYLWHGTDHRVPIHVPAVAACYFVDFAWRAGAD
jgi:hypothetical protein